MKKSKKLLSVLLAVVMLLSSMSVAAFAAKANYKTVADLEANQAYSPYYAVTRLSTEERMSMILDFLDITLGAIENSSMTIPVLNINVNYGSVNGLLKTIDDITGHTLVGTAINIATDNNLLSAVKIDNWKNNCRGMTREGTAQLTILYNLLWFLSDNAPVVKKLCDTGSLELGLLNGALGSIRDTVNGIVKDIPGFLKGYVYPLFERKDDNTDQINALLNTSRTIDETLTSFVKGLFTKPQSTTTYKEDASGNCVSNHELPMTAEATRYYYEKSGEEFTCYAYDTAKKAWVAEPDKFVRTAELDADGNPTGYYTYNKIIGGKPADALKYYEKDSYWLPSLTASGQAETIMDISTNNGADMLYQMVPYVFAEMAPVVLNGSVKKSLAEWFGTKFTYVGEVDSAEVNALPDAADSFFSEPQGEYLWEWSNYAVINGNHYYRFEDSIYSGDTSNKNPYFDIINWDFKITGDFMDEFIPGNAAFMYDRTTVFASLNDFLIKVATTVLNADVISSMGLSNGGNENLVENVKKAAQTVVAISPESIFGSNYNDPDKYYNLMMSDNNQEVLLGIACTLVDLLMPQMILPTADKLAGQNYTVGAVLAAVVREIATQLVPDINYDALIYSEADGYNTKTFLPDKDNGYWLDVCLTIGTDIGYKYITALGDMGEDYPDVFAGANWTASKTYSADDAAAIIGDGGAVKLWEQRVDYIIDWALSSEYEWCWSFGELIDCGATIDLKTAQDPWVKLGAILNNILPINQVLNVNADNSTNPLWLETALRDNFVLALLDLNVEKIVGGDSTEALLKVPDNSVLRTKALLPAVVNVVRDLLNDILYKAIGNQNFISEDAAQNGVDGQIEQVFRSSTSKVQDNLGVLGQNLLQKLFVAHGALLKAALPIVNFFVGWTTDAQKLNDPSLVLTTKVTEGETTTTYPYVYTNGSTAESTLKVTNNSSGMLLQHRKDTNKDDKDYILVIDSVEGDFTTTASLPMEVLPYASAELTVNTPYTEDKGVILRVYYHYKFKDGSEMAAKSLVSPTYQFVSNKKADVPGTTTYNGDSDPYRKTARKGLAGGTAWILAAQPADTTQYKVLDSNETLQNYINSLEFSYKNRADGAAGGMWVTGATMSGNPEWLTLRTGFIHDAATEPSGNVEGYITKDPEDGTVKPYQVDPNTDLTTVYTGAAYIDLGTFNLNWHNNVKAVNTGWASNAKWEHTGGDNNLPDCMVDPGDIYITDTAALRETYDKYKTLIRSSFPHATDEEWAAMQTAIVNAAAVLYRPFTIADFNAGVYNDNAAKVKAMDDAYKVLEATNNGAAYDVASLQTLKDALATAEPGGEVPEINYQDYNLYEYFEYQDERTETRNRIKGYDQPVAPERYIEGSALKAAEIDTLVAAETNAKKAEAISATVKDPKAEDIKAYNEASANWVSPNYTVLSNANQAMMLNYYKQFLIPNVPNKQFLVKELAYAAAQNYVAENYSADSWANYQTALANANTVNDTPDALQSKIFDAKYELMKAQNELLLKEKSAKEQNKYEALNALIAKAEDIFANPTNYNVVEGVAEADAYAALIEALGYKYTDANGNEAILYSRSAYDYVTYDREINDNNMAKVAAAEAKLQAAIDNFAAVAAELPEIIANAGTTGVVDTAKHYLYGIAPKTADINAAFGATHEGSLRLKDGYTTVGTGAEIELLDSTGAVVDTFTVIVFGDLNGDGDVTYVDATMADQYAGGTTSAITGVALTASDTNADGDVTYVDSTMVDQYAGGQTSAISQTVGVFAG